MKKSLLAGSTHAEFLRRHWQKKPLFAPGALIGHANAVTKRDLFSLALRDDVESRVVIRTGAHWQVRHGPFMRADLRDLPLTNWTLLVQGVDHVLPSAARLRSEFSFIPHARVDDVMVSYAAPGGGVGPHFDSYDVFLVQGAGERRWRLSAQRDLDLVMNAPLKVLRRFRQEREVTAAPGDVLYLPPQWAHDGVALGECITCSVGFRAPAANELATHFLAFLEDRLALEGRYADPDLEPARRPGRIPDRMIERSARALDAVRWSDADVAEFLGRYLTEPKVQVVFQRPARKLERAAFVRATRRKGAQLAAATRMLYRGRDVFMNGERSTPSAQARRALERLADTRELPPGADLDRGAARLLYQWYTAGYIRPGTSDEC